ncbi:MAG: response regulator [Candidatus Omnitrophica bacterium]|nr:response regulator [Candidatus Omnitrophota bacterium]
MSGNKKILIIDDESDLTELIGFQFRSKGFEVKTAGDGVEGLDMVHDFKPDLIILDMNMPRMGGIEFYSMICGTNSRPLYPVLVLTARANVENMFKDLEIDGFMIKPFDINQLIVQAETIIKRKAEAQIKKMSAPPKETRRVCVVDDDPQVFKQLSLVLLENEFTVVPAKTGTAAMERMIKDTPDVALVHLGLKDIAGDFVILRLSQMAKTMDVKFILYTFRGQERDSKVMERISEKKGIWTFVEYETLTELLAATQNMFE